MSPSLFAQPHQPHLGKDERLRQGKVGIHLRLLEILSGTVYLLIRAIDPLFTGNMVKTTQQAEAQAKDAPETNATPQHPLGLLQIPAELRNDVYNFTIPEFTELVIPKDFNGSIFDYLSQRLDSNLRLNQQIQDEATMVLLRRTMMTAQKIVVPGPEALNLRLPPNLVFQKVREVEFTSKQGGLADPLSPSGTPFGIHDALLRFPEVRGLTINVTANMLVQQIGDRRWKTMEEIEALMKFDRILDSKHLNTIKLICTDSMEVSRSVDRSYSDIFQDFSNWMWQKFVDRERNISFNIELQPAGGFTGNHYELTWTKKGHITYWFYQDFFG